MESETRPGGVWCWLYAWPSTLILPMNTNDDFILLGYDIRVSASSIDWLNCGVSRISLDACCCLSIDDNIWPRTDKRDSYKAGGSMILNWEESLRLAGEVCSNSAVLVKIEVFKDVSYERSVEEFGNFLIFCDELLSPEPETSAFTTLGYDVGEPSGVSSLCNYQYSPIELQDLRTKFSSTVNGRHLFCSFEDACEFRKHVTSEEPNQCVYRLSIWNPSLSVFNHCSTMVT